MTGVQTCALPISVVAGYGYKYVRIIAPGDVTVANSDRRRFVANFGLLPLQASDFLSQSGYEQRLSPLGLPEFTSPGRTAKKSVLLIQVEALDANVMFAEHGGSPVMPFLRSLAGAGGYIPHMMSYHLGGGTSDAEFTALTSMQPLADYAAFNLPDYRYPNSMPRSFNEVGYRVEAFHGNVGRYWNRRSVFVAMGFDEYWSLDKAGYPESGWGAKDDDVFDFVAGRMDQSSVPFFFLVLTMSSHGPYRNAPQYHVDSRFDDLPAGIERNYLLAMSYVDSALRRFFDRTGDRLDDVIMVIYGDHSEYYVPDDEYSFPRSAVRDGPRRLEFVPCVILGAGKDSVTGTDGATLADLAPTVLAASGIPYRIRSIGTDLMNGLSPRPDVPFSGHEYSREELARFGGSTLLSTKPEGR